MSAIPLYFYNDQGQPDPAGLAFRGVMPVENGADSAVVARCFLRWASMWGSGTIRAAALTSKSAGVADTGWRRLDDGADYWEVPDPARKVYVEGRRDTPGTVVTVDYLPLAK